MIISRNPNHKINTIFSLVAEQNSMQGKKNKGFQNDLPLKSLSLSGTADRYRD